ncbi:unnamed protein product [Acanthocheilonema viteae]|uniref:Uncharacterized protein n=1 Tax=Acanthocheilonema viteae TaxID=6277 RepID=A0A498SJ18_ACAVI|nr:unnamed protein product [Acanthocheilonema viteae]
MAASRNSRSVDLKKERRKENTAQRKSKSSAPSQNTQSIGNITSKDKKKKTTKVQKEHTVAAIAVSDLSQSTKKAVAKFASTSSTSTTIPTIKRSNVAKMTVKMNPTPLVISEGMSKQSSLSAGQRPSTTSIKNRVPTPKPAAKILKSNENSNDDEDSTNEQS